MQVVECWACPQLSPARPKPPPALLPPPPAGAHPSAGAARAQAPALPAGGVPGRGQGGAGGSGRRQAAAAAGGERHGCAPPFASSCTRSRPSGFPLPYLTACSVAAAHLRREHIGALSRALGRAHDLPLRPSPSCAPCCGCAGGGGSAELGAGLPEGVFETLEVFTMEGRQLSHVSCLPLPRACEPPPSPALCIPSAPSCSCAVDSAVRRTLGLRHSVLSWGPLNTVLWCCPGLAPASVAAAPAGNRAVGPSGLCATCCVRWDWPQELERLEQGGAAAEGAAAQGRRELTAVSPPLPLCLPRLLSPASLLGTAQRDACLPAHSRAHLPACLPYCCVSV